jgi:hypothetical protein
MAKLVPFKNSPESEKYAVPLVTSPSTEAERFSVKTAVEELTTCPRMEA